MSTQWMTEALCRQVDAGDLFFPDKGQPVKPGKRVCAACPVRAQCLAYALEQDCRGGIWGGASDTERRRMRRARNAEHRVAAAA